MICPSSFGAFHNSDVDVFVTGSITLLSMILCNCSYNEYIFVVSLSFMSVVYDHTYTGNKYQHHWYHHEVNFNKNFQQPFFTYWDYILGTKGMSYNEEHILCNL